MRIVGRTCDVPTLDETRGASRGGFDGDLSDSAGTEEERPESAEQPVAQGQLRRLLSSTAQDDQLLLEQEILRDHCAHAPGATHFRSRDGHVQQASRRSVIREPASVKAPATLP